MNKLKQYLTWDNFLWCAFWLESFLAIGYLIVGNMDLFQNYALWSVVIVLWIEQRRIKRSIDFKEYFNIPLK